MAQRLTRTENGRDGRRARLWLAASEGIQLSSPAGEFIGPADGAEAPMEVEFVGIGREAQIAAITGFPGGGRFRLKD